MSFNDIEFHEADERPRKKHTGRNILLVLLAVVVAVAVVAGLFVWNMGRNFDRGSTTLATAFPEEADRPAEGSAQDSGTTVLLLGSDKRPEGQEDTGVTGARADSIMLVHVPADGGQLYVMSIMRDTWVDIPGVGEAKINSALDHGGMPLMVETVEKSFGTRVDQVALVDFAGFKGLTDALGGVVVNVPVEFTADNGQHYPAGAQAMDGEQALTFVRERHAFEDGDYQRVRDQRAYLQGLINKLTSRTTLTNPVKVNRVVKEISPYLTVSDGLTAGWIAKQAPQLVGLSSGDVHMFTVPNRGIGTSADGQSIVVADPQAMRQIGEAISDEALDDYVAQLPAGDQ